VGMRLADQTKLADQTNWWIRSIFAIKFGFSSDTRQDTHVRVAGYIKYYTKKFRGGAKNHKSFTAFLFGLGGTTSSKILLQL